MPQRFPTRNIGRGVARWTPVSWILLNEISVVQHFARQIAILQQIQLDYPEADAGAFTVDLLESQCVHAFL